MFIWDFVYVLNLKVEIKKKIVSIMTNNPVIDLFDDPNKKFVKICAPMVRYSR